MIDLSLTFDDAYMRKRRYMAWRGPVVAKAIYDACGLKPRMDVVDVGSGIGDIVQGLVDLGVNAEGIDGSRACLNRLVCDPGRLMIHDMRRPFFDMNEKPFFDDFDIESIDLPYAGPRYGYSNVMRVIYRDGIIDSPNGNFDLAICFEVMPFIEEEFHEVFLRNLTRLSNRLLLGCIDAVPGYEEVPAISERLRAALEPLKAKAAVKAIYNSARYFVRKAQKG